MTEPRQPSRRADQGAPASGSTSETEMQLAERQAIAEREEIDRQSRGFPGSPVASRSIDQVGNPIEDRLAAMEASGAPPYLIAAEKRSMEANRKAWEEQLAISRSKGTPEAPSPTMAVTEEGMQMLTAQQQEQDAILTSRLELHMDNPPRRNGLTLEESILTQPDETIPGGIYVVNGQVVDASGRLLVEPKTQPA